MSVGTRELGSSGVNVSYLSLGSWRTFETISRAHGLAIMRTARDEGVTFLDDARYDDETGLAPIPTGYSEVVFGELLRAAGWNRDTLVIANKLWWEHWPAESAAQELDGSLARMRLEHVDLIYAERPPADLPIDEVVEQVTGLISAGKARAWGLLNWSADQTREAHRIARSSGGVAPVATQLPYSVVQPTPVEDPTMIAALAATNLGVVASYCLAGGVLTGKYASAPAHGRALGRLSEQRTARAVLVAREMSEIARDLGVSAVTLAFAFVAANSSVSSILCGATSADQVHQNALALRQSALVDDEIIATLRNLARVARTDGAATTASA